LLNRSPFSPIVLFAQLEPSYLNITTSPSFTVVVFASNLVSFWGSCIRKPAFGPRYCPPPGVRSAAANLSPFASTVLVYLPPVPFRAPARPDQHGTRGRCWFWSWSWSWSWSWFRSAAARRGVVGSASPRGAPPPSFAHHRFVKVPHVYCIAGICSGTQLLLKFS